MATTKSLPSGEQEQLSSQFVLVAGSDPSSNPQLLKVDASGNLLAALTPVLGSVQRISAGAGAPGQALKTFSSSGGISINAGATVNVYTVAAGKTLFLTDVLISTDNNTPILIQIKAGATVIFEKYVSTTADASLIGIESQPAVGAGVLLSVVFPTVVGKNGSYFISGFEQ